MYREEQIARVNGIDLKTLLEDAGVPLERHGTSRFHLKEHDSCVISGNQWFRFSTGHGGGPIQLCGEFPELFGLPLRPTFPEIMAFLLHHEPQRGLHFTDDSSGSPNTRRKAPEAFLVLPARAKTMQHVFQYLVGVRGIEQEIVDYFARCGKIYENGEPFRGHKLHEIVFVGFDERNFARAAQLRQSYDGNGKAFRYNVPGSEFDHVYFGHVGTSNQVFFFEAPIDLLSFITLHPKDWQHQSYVACFGGISSKPLLAFLAQRPDVREVCLCVDDDDAGHKAIERMVCELIPKGYLPRFIFPRMGKDWNEELQYKKGLPVEISAKAGPFASGGREEKIGYLGEHVTSKQMGCFIS